MPALQQPQYGIENLYLFPCYMTIDDYTRATGKTPPAWNPDRSPKYWEDPSAKNSLKRSVVYDRAFVLDQQGHYVPDTDGKPMIDLLVLNKDDAATVNIAPSSANIPGNDKSMVPPPLRALFPNEELAFVMTVPVVRNIDLFDAQASGFGPEERALLRKIAAKLGVTA